MSLPTVEEWMHPAARLGRNRERGRELRKMLRLLAGTRDVWQDDDRKLFGDIAREIQRLDSQRLPLVRQALGVWPMTTPNQANKS